MRYHARSMDQDVQICYCYHVSLRKLINFAKRVKPRQPSRMTECLNAGTGCGWCIPFLQKIARDPDQFSLGGMTPDEYAEKRRIYRTSGQEKNTFSRSDA